MIDISKGYRQYSPTELREYAYKNLMSVGSFELGDFLEYVFTDYKLEIDQEEVAEARQEGYDRGWSDAKHEAIAAVENI
jgi:hypothetical protein